jgi:phosphate transport system ATP-binding protein
LTEALTNVAPIASIENTARIRIRGLSVDYGASTALRDVDLDVAAGRITALIGPSGCGKSSLLASLNRMTDLIPGCRTSGRILLGNREVTSPETDLLALRRRVGMIFQRPNPFPLSIRQNIQLPLREHGLRDRAALTERTRTALEEVGLWEEVWDRLDSSAQALSGGQQQRLCIARALVLRPDVLLLDEPCSALDPIASGVVEDRIAAMRGNLTVLIVTHNLAQARRIADDVAVMWLRDGAGCMIESGPCRKVFENPKDPDAAAYVNGQRG